MEIEAGRYNAEFVRKPIKPAEFLENVARCLAPCDGSGAGRASGIAGGFRVTAAGMPAAVMDVSATADCAWRLPRRVEVPHTFEIAVRASDLRLEVRACVVLPCCRAATALVCGADARVRQLRLPRRPGERSSIACRVGRVRAVSLSPC